MNRRLRVPNRVQTIALLVGSLLLSGFTLAQDKAATPAPRQETEVGITGKLEGVVLPGPELEAKPITDRKQPVVLRVTSVYPHGTNFRYDLEYFGLDPGTYDLKNYLQRKDGSSTDGLPALTVKVNPIRPPGQVTPNPLTIEEGPTLGGYRLLMWSLGAVWVLGLLALIASFFFPRAKTGPALAQKKPASLAERLRPLVDGAVAGQLSQPELAALERGLFTYWRKRLRLENVEPAEAMNRLRQDADAGPLLAQLEAWLHQPNPQPPADLAGLLRPYRDVPPDALKLPGDAA